MTKEVIKKIEWGVANGQVDDRWAVTKKEASKKGVPSLPEGGQPRGVGKVDEYIVAGQFKNASGAPLLDFSFSQSAKTFQVYNIHFDAICGKQSVGFNDLQPDGKVSEDDEIWINAARYRLINRGAVRGHEAEDGVFLFSAFGGAIDHGIRGDTPYHGLEFIRDKDQWKFRGPDSRKAQGLEVQELLNRLAEQYEAAVAEAASHVK